MVAACKLFHGRLAPGAKLCRLSNQRHGEVSLCVKGEEEARAAGDDGFPEGEGENTAHGHLRNMKKKR